MPKRELDPNLIYYVYVLFDWLGIPRYVGKGKGCRWLKHELNSDSFNWLKNEFIEQTWIMLGEIPKLIIQENMNETDAFNAEIALIKAIGRIDLNTGLLTNMTSGGDGVLGQAYSPKPLTPGTPDHDAWRISISQSHRRRTREQIEESTVLRLSNYPPGFWSNKRLEYWAGKTSEERKQWALKGSNSVEHVLWINNGITNKRTKLEQEIPEGWTTGRLYNPPEQFKYAAVSTIWITNGSKSRRLKANNSVPDGWIIGRRAKKFCACGCGESINLRSTWYRGHYKQKLSN